VTPPAATRAATAPAVSRGEPSAWMVVPVVAGALALLVLGIHPPAELTELFGRAIRLLGGSAS
jgi:hydrogenase-4 component F